MKVVDTRGEKCPRPIIETKKALKEISPGEIFAVLTDNKTSFDNISRFLTDNRIKFSVSESGGVWKFEVNNEKGIVDTTPAEEYCETDKSKMASGDYAIAISSELMGSGDDVLGKKLMKSFFVSLSCMDNMPSVIVFYNSGVKLATSDSDIAEYLLEFEKRGVEMIMCGTCIDHFKLEGKISTGKIGDMYLILEKLASASNVIRP